LLEISYEARLALRLLEENGFEAYLVGGCVRDYILKRPFNDYDITTSATPDEVKKVFYKFRVIETGIKHGTVTVLIDSVPIEITTYRVDGDYKDNRHPETVEFSKKLSDDLCRRDFTVNALAYNKNIVDMFNGIDDLNKKLIRCVGDPDKRFNEDGLRIIRALRFASVLGFDIEEETGKSIIKNKHLLKNVSSERIFEELKKLLCGVNSKNIIEKYGVVFDELFNGKNFSKRAESIDNCPYDINVRTASLFLEDNFFREDLSMLRVDNKFYNRCINAINNYSCELNADKISVKKYLNRFGGQTLTDVLYLREAEGYDVFGIREIYQEIKANKECYLVSELDISGADLILLGYKDKQIGDALNLLLKLVIEEKLPNTREELYKYAKENLL